MFHFITIDFEYGKKMYRSLIRSKKFRSHREHAITIMNGELEKQLFGNHIIKEKDGCLQIEVSENGEQQMLKKRIARALSKLLRMPLLEKRQTKGVEGL